MRRRSAARLLLLGLLGGGCGARGRRDAPRIRVAVRFGATTLDPHAEATASQFALLYNLYEPLAGLDHGLRPRPALARRWSSPDRSTWVFELRPGVRFHSGRRLSARDVVYSIRRVAGDPELGVRYYLSDVESVEARGPLTVVIRTRRPTSILLSRLSYVLVVPEGAGGGLTGGADGTGPFRLSGWESNRALTLRRYDDYWGPAPALGERPSGWASRRPSRECARDATSSRRSAADLPIRASKAPRVCGC